MVVNLLAYPSKDAISVRSLIIGLEITPDREQHTVLYRKPTDES